METSSLITASTPSGGKSVGTFPGGPCAADRSLETGADAGCDKVNDISRRHVAFKRLAKRLTLSGEVQLLAPRRCRRYRRRGPRHRTDRRCSLAPSPGLRWMLVWSSSVGRQCRADHGCNTSGPQLLRQPRLRRQRRLPGGPVACHPLGSRQPLTSVKIAGMTISVSNVDEIIANHRHGDPLHDLRASSGAPHDAGSRDFDIARLITLRGGSRPAINPTHRQYLCPRSSTPTL
jgi:hypothetical protein